MRIKKDKQRLSQERPLRRRTTAVTLATLRMANPRVRTPSQEIKPYLRLLRPGRVVMAHP